MAQLFYIVQMSYKYSTNSSIPKSTRHYRIKTQPKIVQEQALQSETISFDSIVLQSQATSLHNYFHFLENLFGNKEQVRKVISKMPQKKAITQQYQKISKKSQQSRQNDNSSKSIWLKSKRVSSTTVLQPDDIGNNNVQTFKYSIFQRPTRKIKMKLLLPERKRNSCIIEKIVKEDTKIEKKINFQVANSLEDESFTPLGRTISKDKGKNSIFKINKKNQIKRTQINPRFYRGSTLGHHQQPQNSPQRTQQPQGPWKVVETTQYNPRCFYSTFR